MIIAISNFQIPGIHVHHPLAMTFQTTFLQSIMDSRCRDSSAGGDGPRL